MFAGKATSNLVYTARNQRRDDSLSCTAFLPRDVFPFLADIFCGTGVNRAQQMAEFLAAKTRDVLAVIDEAREASATHTAGIGEARARYNRICG